MAAPVARVNRRAVVESPEVGLEELLLNMHRLSNMFADSELLKNNELTISEWAIVNVLDKDRTLNLRDVVRRSGVSRQRIRKVLHELEAKNLVTISAAHEGDKRQRIVAATSKCAAARQAMLASLRNLLGNTTLTTNKGGDGRRLGRRLSSAARVAKQIARSLKSKRERAAEEAEEFWTADKTREHVQ